MQLELLKSINEVKLRESLVDLKEAIQKTKGIHEKDVFGLLNKICLIEDISDELSRS